MDLKSLTRMIEVHNMHELQTMSTMMKAQVKSVFVQAKVDVNRNFF